MLPAFPLSPILLEPYSHFRCGICGSWRGESQYGLGPSRGWSIPLSPVERGGKTSEVAEKLLGPGHTHQWTFSKGSDGYVFIRWGMICGEDGRARENPFIREWAEGMSFGRFVDGERSAGRLTQEEVLAIAELPCRPSFEQAQDAKIVKAFSRARELLKASGVRDTGSEWSRWSLPEAASNVLGPRK
jgi:hypothetical protein